LSDRSLRLQYDPGQDVLFLNFEGMTIRTRANIENVRTSTSTRARLGTALAGGRDAPHLYDSKAEALAGLKRRI
jgi:hypothetical protein